MSQAPPDPVACREADEPSAPRGEPGRAKRREPRRPASILAAIRLQDGTEIPCIVKDMSLSGAKLGIPEHCTLPERFLFKMQNRPLVFAVRLAWRKERYAGVRIERIAKLPARPQRA